jgi:AraC-like DNA-binding protein
VQLRQTCVLREPELARQLDAAWLSMRAQSDSLATDELFSRACAQIDVRHDSDRACRQPLDQPALTRVRDYLHEHLSEHVRLGDLAAIASMSRFQLTRQFARVYGLPLHAYQLHLRLADAKRRLSRGVPIVKVAADLGFADQSHLNRRFKGSFGMTPGAWRDAATHSHLA